MISAGNPNALPSGHEDNDVPTFWLLLKASDGLLRYQGYNKDLGGCQNYGPFLGPYYTTAPISQGTEKGDLNFDNYPFRKVFIVEGLWAG